jgi:hypothetical protein
MDVRNRVMGHPLQPLVAHTKWPTTGVYTQLLPLQAAQSFVGSTHVSRLEVQ